MVEDARALKRVGVGWGGRAKVVCGRLDMVLFYSILRKWREIELKGINFNACSALVRHGGTERRFLFHINDD